MRKKDTTKPETKKYNYMCLSPEQSLAELLQIQPKPNLIQLLTLFAL